MRRLTSLGLLIPVSLVACAWLRPSPPPAPGTVPEAAATVTKPAPAEQTVTTEAATPPATTVKAPAPSSTESPPVKAPAASAAKAKVPRANGTAKLPPRAAAPANQTTVASAPEKPPAAPSLDLGSLEQRLRDTHAIGLFTKLSLKNQVDDLLGAVRTFHGGRTIPPLSDLRQRYDLLLLKVLTLLQDGDPPLASAISASREAIWGILADREKFQKIQLG